jgi:hypothetical protein
MVIELVSEPAPRVVPGRPLDLFELPMVFGQAPLLAGSECERQLERRGLWPLGLGQIEELHRTRLLQPVFRLVRDDLVERGLASRQKALDWLRWRGDDNSVESYAWVGA